MGHGFVGKIYAGTIFAGTVFAGPDLWGLCFWGPYLEGTCSTPILVLKGGKISGSETFLYALFLSIFLRSARQTNKCIGGRLFVAYFNSPCAFYQSPS